MSVNSNKGRFGVVDALVILLVVLLACGGFWYYFSGRLLDSGKEVNLTYEVRITALRSELTSQVNYGDKVFDSVYGEYVGTVEKVRTEQYTEQVMDKSSGELVNAVKSGYYNMYITVNATAQYKEPFYYINGSEIRVGESVYLRLADFCGEGYCTSVSVAKDGES